MSNIFTVLALIITGLGLLGLAAYSAEQRTKEIGIRKVMGANIGNIITLVSSDFTRLVLIAFAISAPVSWWLMKLYLERYQIKTELQLWIFLMTGLIALLFALFIVVTQSLKAANANPVDSLRYNGVITQPRIKRKLLNSDRLGFYWSIVYLYLAFTFCLCRQILSNKNLNYSENLDH